MPRTASLCHGSHACQCEVVVSSECTRWLRFRAQGTQGSRAGRLQQNGSTGVGAVRLSWGANNRVSCGRAPIAQARAASDKNKNMWVRKQGARAARDLQPAIKAFY
eukprot:2649168-Rhodomonas_salina.1